MKITFSGYHDTEISVYAKNGELTENQLNRIYKAMCSKEGCFCRKKPVTGVTVAGALAEIKDDRLYVYYEVWVEYDIENLPFITSADFCADVDGWAETVQGSYSPRGKYLAMIKCPVENYEWLLDAIQDSDSGLVVVK